MINKKQLTKIIKENQTINETENIDLKKNIECIPINGNIYWNNEKSLEIIKLKEQIKNSNNYIISFKIIQIFIKEKIHVFQ